MFAAVRSKHSGPRLEHTAKQPQPKKLPVFQGRSRAEWNWILPATLCCRLRHLERKPKAPDEDHASYLCQGPCCERTGRESFSLVERNRVSCEFCTLFEAAVGIFSKWIDYERALSWPAALNLRRDAPCRLRRGRQHRDSSIRASYFI